MRVFTRRSGEPSRSIARALDRWIEQVVQHVDAWVSTHDVPSGAQWTKRLRNRSKRPTSASSVLLGISNRPGS
jgi:hypothetical protein